MSTFEQLGVPLAPSGYPLAEDCTLIVNNQQFSDWETVWVQHRWTDSFAYFKFTAAERTPLPANWTLLQFKPGDACTIQLAGQLALTGYIVERQTQYDANTHSVQLIGKSTTFWGYKSSVDTPTLSFDNKTFEQIAREVLAKYPGQVTVVGTLNALPFDKCSAQIGESCWDFLERLARPRGIVLGSDYKGDYVLIGQHTYPIIVELTEGVNIKACNCIISHDVFFENYEVRAQKAGNNQDFGPSANQLTCGVPGTASAYSKLITPAEQPVKTQGEVCDRAYNEAKWHQGEIIQATVVVYGWTADGTNLWQAGSDVFVNSPMAMLNMALKIQTVTFTQDDRGGTLTTLDLVAPWLLNDFGNWDVGIPGAPQAPQTVPTQTQVTPSANQ